MRLWTLSNPLVAPIVAIVAAGLISFVLALTIVWLLHGWILDRKIEKHSEGALRTLQEQQGVLQDEIIIRDAQIIAMKARLAEISVHLGKAVSAVGR